jgi:hypothetical protein
MDGDITERLERSVDVRLRSDQRGRWDHKKMW